MTAIGLISDSELSDYSDPEDNDGDGGDVDGPRGDGEGGRRVKRSMNQKRSRTSAKCCWIKSPSDVAERCRGGLSQVRNVVLSRRGVCGMIFGSIPTILSHWFKKRRSLAFGISDTGSSLSGIIIPIVSSQ